ncbi:stage III sporulation protein AF [Caproiciproducens sp. CPB-2]|uniref:stage III sporulation protein AF n=1 Tax=unclassified Caproiciproducens TaxID=2643836 RepID=UPI0023DBCECA|nr:stage III sporulation protein AF [Caproiciproducens sp. CPB-2]MDF1496209.1 stage III sporulation protein AF [Caproiciproducens sp. CPB-2]
MNAVREWSAAICMAALVAAMLQGLVPSGSMERMVKFVIGAFVICALIVPLAKIVPEISMSIQTDSDSPVNSQLEKTVEKQYSAAAQESITNLVVSELNNIDIKCKNVNVIMDTNEDGSISINKVVVILAKGYGKDREKASAHLEKTLGLKMEVSSDES